MKIYTLILLIAITLPGIAQKKFKEKAPKGMEFCPQGSFQMTKINDSDTAQMRVAIRGFWMSNEITNKEFRQFYQYLKDNPEDSISWIKILKTENKTTDHKNTTRKTFTNKNVEIKSIANSAILEKHIDLDTMNGAAENNQYFTSPKFDNYPVVGVSATVAKYYCIWLTDQTNKKLEAQKKPQVMAYRLPTEAEWEYVWSQGIKESDISIAEKLHPVKKGDLNYFNLFNFGQNVSEWTSSSKNIEEKKVLIVKGVSWKNNNTRTLFLNPDSKLNYVGFRIVRDYIGN